MVGECRRRAALLRRREWFDGLDTGRFVRAVADRPALLDTLISSFGVDYIRPAVASGLAACRDLERSNAEIARLQAELDG